MLSRQLICALAVLFVGRLGVYAQTTAATAPLPTADNNAISQLDYVLQPSDLVRMVVFQEPDLQRDMQLSADSKLSLPLIGEVDLKGMTLSQAQKIIHDRYDAGYLVNPQINLTVLEYKKDLVDVLGSVNTPGSVNIPHDQPLNLLGAIARAGGFTRLADRKRVKLTRETEDHQRVTTIVNADAIIQSNNQNQQQLKKGDVIFVPEKIL